MNITSDFLAELLSNLESIGVPEDNIVCILHGGSSLYLKNFEDIDFKVIVKRHNPYAKIERSFLIQGYKVDCCTHTISEWNSMLDKEKCYYIAESVDMVKIIGNDSLLHRYDCVKEKEVRDHLIKIYDTYFWSDTPTMEDKRLWNFLLFYYKCENKSHKLTPKQLKIVQKAHDLKYSKSMFKDYFTKLKGEIL